MTLFVATSNPGKLRDFAAAAAVWSGVVIAPLAGLSGIAAPAEDEATFEGNARLKAVFYSAFAGGEIVLADDSGLEVEALGGAPGVRSARYADDLAWPGSGTVDARNNSCLLRALDGVADRRARYRCALAAARDGVVIAIADGEVEGEILDDRRGEGGFGYDPLFLVNQFGKTMAELDARSRLACSHRGRALSALLGMLG